MEAQPSAELVGHVPGPKGPTPVWFVGYGVDETWDFIQRRAVEILIVANGGELCPEPRQRVTRTEASHD